MPQSNPKYDYRLEHPDRRKIEGTLEFAPDGRGMVTDVNILGDWTSFDYAFKPDNTCELLLRFHAVTAGDTAIWARGFPSPDWSRFWIVSEQGWAGYAFVKEDSWSLATVFDTQPKSDTEVPT